MSVLVALWLMWAIAEAAFAQPDAPQPRTLALPTALVLLAGQCAVVAAGPSGTIACAVAGLVVTAAGAALRVWAIRTLGDAFRTALESPRLVVTGPYRWLRHPSELGLVAVALGGAVYAASVLAAAATVVVAALSIVRCRRETRALRAGHAVAHAAWAPVV
jgi:protein-S-isoprenylcysteine O-methyltransferase Ste14